RHSCRECPDRHRIVTIPRYTHGVDRETRQSNKEQVMDIIVELLRAALMIGFIVAVIVALAGLIMIVFGIATGMDKNMQE
ncbi:MAG TPA: hypothetical protein VGR08_04435, partial [Thermomicrobiales bacterium]|nr:hypothetical protein [Thermomicrobiales bacterium]